MKTLRLIAAIAVLGLGTIHTCSDVVTADNPPESPHRISNGFDVHGGFEALYVDPEFICYEFKAISKWQGHTCNICQKTYYTQSFRDKNNKDYLMYAYSKCTKSKTGYHDELELGDIYPCVCTKDIYVKK